MKAAVENAGTLYLEKKAAWVQLCHTEDEARRKKQAAESEMEAAAIGIREAIAESMDLPKDTLWLPFGKTIIEVQKGYTTAKGIFTHRLED